MAAHSSILAWRIHGQRSLVSYSPLDHKESNTIYRLNKKKKELQSCKEGVTLLSLPSPVTFFSVNTGLNSCLEWRFGICQLTPTGQFQTPRETWNNSNI